ncbi:MAG: hypothetical protein AAFQ94_25380 [Bacteroidota bacterium]
MSFIPVISKWPPVYPENDLTQQNVRAEILFHERYVITPNDDLVGENYILDSNYLIEQLDLSVETIDSKVVIYFVSIQKFKKYSVEANRLWNEIERIGGDTSFEKMKGQFEVVRFIDEKIINSPYLTDRELNAIGRMRDAEGNMVPDPQYQY